MNYDKAYLQKKYPQQQNESYAESVFTFGLILLMVAVLGLIIYLIPYAVK